MLNSLIQDDDLFTQQLRHFEVVYDNTSILNKAHHYQLKQKQLLGPYTVDLNGLEKAFQLTIGQEYQTSLEQLSILVATWPEQFEIDAFCTRMNACVEAWTEACRLEAPISCVFNIISSINFAHVNQQDAVNHSFKLFLFDVLSDSVQAYQNNQIHYLLDHDVVTHLPNTNLLLKEISHCLDENNLAFSVLAIRFMIERGATTVSPLIPPHLSSKIVAILETCFPAPFSIYQSGHLLFSVMIKKSMSATQLRLLFAKLHRSFEQIININQQAFLVMPVIGAVSDLNVKDARIIYNQARLALNHAIQLHLNSVVYSAEIAEKIEKQKSLELDVTAAFNNEDLELYLQPIVSLPTQTCVGAEVLLRWPNANTKGIYPNVVVEIINKIGMGKLFTRWLVNSVCRLAHDLIHQHQLSIYLTLNLRAEDLYDSELPHLIQQSASFWKIHPHDIILEITENGILEENETTVHTIQELTDFGFKLALDDFGTGYSSMARLRNMPISLIKIDQSFVKNIDQSIKDYEIVKSMSALASSLGKEVLVEGVETEAALNRINHLGINKAQGYYFSKPMPFNDFVAWSKNNICN